MITDSRSIIHGVFTPLSEVIWLLYFIGPYALCDSNHPQELVDVIAMTRQRADHQMR